MRAALTLRSARRADEASVPRVHTTDTTTIYGGTHTMTSVTTLITVSYLVIVPITFQTLHETRKLKKIDEFKTK